MQKVLDIEDATLFLGNCFEILPNIPIDPSYAMITDPPYGIGYKTSRKRKNENGSSWIGRKIIGDDTSTSRDFAIDWAQSKDLPWACFGSWKVAPPDNTRGSLVWDKEVGGMGDLSFPWKPSWELIYIGGPGWKGRRDEGVLRGHHMTPYEDKGRTHPTEKPVSLIRELLKKLPDVTTVIDPFCGTGSTGVACIREGKKFIGIEIAPDYIDVAKRRIEDKQPLFAMEESC